MFVLACTLQSSCVKCAVLQLGLDVWKRLLAEPLKDTIVTLLLAELHRYFTGDVLIPDYDFNRQL